MSKLKYLSIQEFVEENAHREFVYCVDNDTKWTLGTKIVAKCIKHNRVYKLVPLTFIKGAGCPECRSTAIGTSLRKHIDEFIKTANVVHNHQYDYSKVIYKNASTKVSIICKKHGEFYQSPTNHVHGKNGCPKCKITKIIPNFKTTNIGKSETKWLDMLGVPCRQYPVGCCFVDGYDPDTNTIYEFLGDFWHGNPDLYDSNDINPRNKKSFGYLWESTLSRFEYFLNLGYKVVYIWQSDAIKNKPPLTYKSKVTTMPLHCM